MDRSVFALRLREAVLSAVQDFLAQHADESPYGFAIIMGQCGNSLGYAIATEERLAKTAAHYESIGYRFETWEWEEVDQQEKLRIWLRWANPDDGWHFGEFPSQYQIQNQLSDLVAADVFGEDASYLEEFCTEVLTSLQSDAEWQAIQKNRPVVLGVTAGEDPRDFLRTATRCNPYGLVSYLWNQSMQAEEVSSRIRKRKK